MKQNNRIVSVKEQGQGMRLDKYLVFAASGISRNHIQRAVKKGYVKINGVLVSEPSFKLKQNDLVEIDLQFLAENKIPLSSVCIPILYQDNDVVVIDKPLGLIVHPVGPHKDSVVGSLLNQGVSLFHTEDARPGVVHRLDKDTSGLMILAKTVTAYKSLYNQFKERRITKEYIAVVRGILSCKEAKIDVPLKREKYKPKMKVSFLGSKKALTYYRVVEEKTGYSLVRIYLKTGRMHQIRVHFSYLGHPVVGDKKYGKEEKKQDRLYLHSVKLGFCHPLSNEYLEFESSAPFSLDDIK